VIDVFVKSLRSRFRTGAMIDILIVLGALTLLIVGAYRGYSVILLAPAAAMLALLLIDPSAVPAVFSGLYMEKLAGFVKLYFPVFLLGAVFGKLIEVSGFSSSLVATAMRIMGPNRAMPAIVLVCALLTYGGVSLFVVVFAAYPFAAEIFRRADIPKRLIPGTIALGAFTFTMDSLPGSPQIQNIIPTSFFGTTAWAAPILGLCGSAFILAAGSLYLERARRRALAMGEGYGTGHRNEPVAPDETTVHPLRALVPLLVVAGVNFAMTRAILHVYPAIVETRLAGLDHPISTDIRAVSAVWAVQGALLAGILSVLALGFGRIVHRFADEAGGAIAGALLASLNTASEYGFGAVIAALPGFALIRAGLSAVPNPLVNEAVTITTLAGVTGSASGGLSIALGAMAKDFLVAANSAGISPEVLHRVASMASGGMDTLPHNGAIITLLTVTGLTHRQSYRDILALTGIKTLAVGVVIGVYYLTGWH
jgi:H+/gluconate symporter-like permease